MTSAKFPGSLGLIKDIDLKCQTAAMAAGLANHSDFKVWLSTGSTWPAMRMDTGYVGRYVLVDGTPVAENGWQDLTDGSLSHAIDRTELGGKVSTAPWTNTKADGTNAGTDHCQNWTTEDGSFDGHHGQTNATDATWTDAMKTAPCSAASPLYCIEDP